MFGVGGSAISLHSEKLFRGKLCDSQHMKHYLRNFPVKKLP